MQSFKLIKSPNQESEDPNDIPHTSRAGMPGQHFFIELFQYAVGDTNKINGLSTQFLIDTGATYSIINCDTFTEIEKIQPLVVMPLEKSPLAANGHAMPMKGKVVIQSAFDVEYSGVIEHTVYVSDSPEARMNILGMDFLAKFGKFNLRNPMLILTVFPGKCVKLSPYLDEPFPYFSQVNSVELSQDLTIAPYSTRVLTLIAKNEDKHLFRKGTSFRLHRNVLDTGIYTYHVYCSHDESKYPLMLNNPNPKSITIRKGILGYTLLDFIQETTQTMSVIDNVAFIGFVKAFDSELNNDMHVCSTEPYIYSLTEIDSRNKLSEMAVSQNELATDFSNEVKSLQPQMPKLACDIKRKQLNEKFFSEFSPTEQTFLKNFDFSECDITDSELQHLLRVLIENNDVFSKFTYDVGKITQEFHVKLKKDAELRKQRPSKVPLHYRDRLEILLNELQRAGIIREMGSGVEMGSLSTNPIIILPKGDTVKLVIDARYLNSITDLSNYSWPLEPIKMLLTRLDGVYYTTSDLASAYNQVPLSEDTKKLTSFVVSGKQYMFERGFYGLCCLPNFFSRIMTIHFAEMIAKKQAITYIDDVILQAKTKSEMWKNLESYFKCLRSSGLKAAPNKTKLFLRKVQFLGHIVSDKGIQPFAKKVQDLKDLKSPENKRDVMRVLGSLGFYSTFIKNLHVDSKPFYELLRDDVPFKWTKEHEELFRNIKDRISETILAVPNPKYPFHIHVDSSSIGTGSILVQEVLSGKRIVSFNSRVFTKDEQKMSTLHRELCGIISALQTYEHFIIGSPHPIKIFCDHKPLLYLWARKVRLSHRFFRYQVIITQFTNLQITWTPGKNLAFPDLLSRNVSLKDLNGKQLAHKEIPKDIRFFN